MHTKTRSGFIKWAIVVAIVVVLNLFFSYAISLAYKAPQYDDYVSSQAEPMPYNDAAYTAQVNTFQAAQKNYDRSVFIVLVVLGIIVLVLGSLFTNEILSLSFAWGGVLSLIIASMRYWTDADNLFKVIILAVALGVLIWVAVKKFEK